MKSIAILTSGGDAPGMNAAIRSITRTALANNIQVFGIERGFSGLVYEEYRELHRPSVSNIIQRGGTILKSSRCDEWRTPQGRQKGARFLEKLGVSGLIGIGGDGTFKGLYHFSQEYDIPVIGIPGTIDNDIYGTDMTIGYDTAVNIGVDAIDKIRDTADSHERLFVIEVMGRNSGFIALNVGIGGGAEEIIIPEQEINVEDIAERLFQGRKKGKTSSIIVVAEGDEEGKSYTIANKIKRISGMEYRVVILGHIQRGGSPSAFDRYLGSFLGSEAVFGLINGHSHEMVGLVNNQIKFSKFSEVWNKKKTIDQRLLRLNYYLS
ncbi:MAG: 6-phosphofructokinase [Calditrichaeota bacterium]|nr:MAG: 6-phosphofructokinase [Calditrichota bacterium]